MLDRLVTQVANVAADIEAWVRDEPSGAYARRAWFPYKFMTAGILGLADVMNGGYVNIMDDAGQRNFQNYVGENLRTYGERVHFVCPCPQDMDSMMDAWMRQGTRKRYRCRQRYGLSVQLFRWNRSGSVPVRKIIDVVRVDLREQLTFMATYESVLEAVRSIVDMPDKKLP